MSHNIYITELDRQTLNKIVNDETEYFKDKKHIRDLEMELMQAKVVSNNQLPDDVITMNSRVLLLVDGSEEEITLVYPHEANVAENKISVLSPIGVAILGYREGDNIEWCVPSGAIKVIVKKVLYQPEAAEKNGAVQQANKQQESI